MASKSMTDSDIIENMEDSADEMVIHSKKYCVFGGSYFLNELKNILNIFSTL